MMVTCTRMRSHTVSSEHSSKAGYFGQRLHRLFAVAAGDLCCLSSI